RSGPGGRPLTLRLGVCVSGQGSNLRNLVERGFNVVAVATNRPSCGGAAFARERGIPLGELSQKSFASAEDRDAAMREFFVGHQVELVVDAGYDRVHSQGFLEAFGGRIINVHPSLLPEFGGGMDAVERALASGANMTGATVHVVTRDLDAGPVLVQEAVPVLERDTVETLRQRVHEAEYRILPQAIQLMEDRLAHSPSVG
ncbi:MAG TPA: phosphoribosylglycinamide formyltransferase, partial [Candidatus Dormibacteraeota bacterium]|nr:phosphoribosylglycinamide formyltransferase [Candidatus Dormibacteraeota bacterium]